MLRCGLFPCRFDGMFRKPTRLRCWGWAPSTLDKDCQLRHGTFDCGRPRAEPHPHLGFGGYSTADAAEYVPGVCKAWASEIAKCFSNILTLDGLRRGTGGRLGHRGPLQTSPGQRYRRPIPERGEARGRQTVHCRYEKSVSVGIGLATALDGYVSHPTST